MTTAIDVGGHWLFFRPVAKLFEIKTYDDIKLNLS